MEPANPNIPSLKEKSKGKGKDTDNVRCPLGCKTTGYDSTTRYHEHLRKTHGFTKECIKPMTDLVRKNGHLSLGEKWKITYPMVVSQNSTTPQDMAVPQEIAVPQQMTLSQETTVPPPYIHSAEEYKFASRNPRQAILERIKAKIHNGVIQPPTDGWFFLSSDEMDHYLKDVWLAVVPFFLDSVDEEGLYQSQPDVTTEHDTNLFYGDNPNTRIWPVPN